MHSPSPPQIGRIGGHVHPDRQLGTQPTPEGSHTVPAGHPSAQLGRHICAGPRGVQLVASGHGPAAHGREQTPWPVPGPPIPPPPIVKQNALAHSAGSAQAAPMGLVPVDGWQVASAPHNCPKGHSKLLRQGVGGGAGASHSPLGPQTNVSPQLQPSRQSGKQPWSSALHT